MGTRGWKEEEGVARIRRRGDKRVARRMMECIKLCVPPTPHSIEEIKELCSRRRRGEEGGDLEHGAGGWGPGALELITE